MSEAIRYLNTAEVAEKLGVTRQHVYLLMESGAMPFVDVSLPGAQRKTRRVSEAELEKWLNARTNDRRRR